MKLRFIFTPEEQGVCFALVCSKILRNEYLLPFKEWEQHISTELRPTFSTLMRIHEEYPGQKRNEGLLLEHRTIANLTQSEAHILGLPPVTPFSLHMQSIGNISQENFQIETSWLSPQGIKVMGARTCGAMLQYKSQWQRIPDTLYTLSKSILACNELPPDAQDERRKLLAQITSLLPEEAQAQVSKDGFLNSLRVYHAAALSLTLNTHDGTFDFIPVLFGQNIASQTMELSAPKESVETPTLITEAQSLLPENFQDTFIKHFEHTYHFTRSSYTLGDNRYLYIEPMLQQALEIVRNMRSASPQVQREFVRSPQKFFKEQLGEQFDESALEAMFVATQEYSERVTGMSLWIKKALPWIQHSDNAWLPESYGIVADNAVTIIPNSESAAKNIELLKEAMNCGDPLVCIRGSVPDGGEVVGNTTFCAALTVPASPETQRSLESIHSLLKSREATNIAAGQEETPTEKRKLKIGPIFLDTEENFDITTYSQYRPRPEVNLHLRFPEGINTDLKQHQKEAVEWLARMWSAGYSGALLADDMGLGKTLSCLVFLMWLQRRRKELCRKKLPILIVAPTSLIYNWQQEVNIHLQHPGLGELLVVNGVNIKNLRRKDQASGRDIYDGTSRLDTRYMEQMDWILVTYETLRDYHHSFAALPLASVVYDEMQKAKNPTSQINSAIRTLNAEFSIGLTGTPIENTLIDLWALMNVLLPGFLGELRQFNATYAQSDEATLHELKETIEGKAQDTFRPMLRRMKRNTLAGLPAKHEHVFHTVMPEYQAHAYEEALCDHQDPLALLQALRMVSLHPLRPDNMQNDLETYQQVSARFNTMWDILKEIQKKQEKVLIFLESREHQPVLAFLLQKRYHLSRLPMIINGQTPAQCRQRYVTIFQSEQAFFDVIILSPKAAGMGLTLTSANHVIHLSRWWNPAVEDQCTDRIYRLGQQREIHVYYPLAIHNQPHLENYSFDLQLHKLLEKKRQLSQEVLLPPQTGTEVSELYEMLNATAKKKEQ